jgi:hypothetical protein
MSAEWGVALMFLSTCFAGIACALVHERSTKVYSFRWVLASQGSGPSGCRRVQGSRQCTEKVRVYVFVCFQLP